MIPVSRKFENDVKIYGIKTVPEAVVKFVEFENDVKIYGIKTVCGWVMATVKFENDVKIYGIKTLKHPQLRAVCLRMM